MITFQKGCLSFVNGGKYPHCHSVLIDDQTRVVIDASSSKEILLDFHKESPINVLLASHGHEDHFMHNYLFPKAELWAHELEAPCFAIMDKLIDLYVPKGPGEAEARQAWEQFLIDEINYQPRQTDRNLKGGESISFGRTQVEVLLTSGHSPGHLSFWFPVEKVVFTGDLDLVRAGPYYGDPKSSIEDTINSLNMLAELGAETVLTAHGREGIFDGDPEHFYRYRDCIFEREARILELLKSGSKTLIEITDAGIIYNNRTMAGAWDLYLSEKSMMEKHLIRLIDQGTVVQENGRFSPTSS